MEQQNYFPGLPKFIAEVLDDTKPVPRQYVNIFEGVINLIELSLQIFVCCTVRIYEDRITDENSNFIKKTVPIRNILRDRFAAPSLGTHIEIAQKCFHLIDAEGSDELVAMKNHLAETISLGAIGTLITDLENIFEKINKSEPDTGKPVTGKAKVVEREKSKKPLLTGILAEFVSFRNDSAHLNSIRNLIEDNEGQLKLNLDSWKNAFRYFLSILQPLLSQTFQTKSLGPIQSAGAQKQILVLRSTFKNGIINNGEENVPLEEWYEDKWDSQSEIIMHKGSKTLCVNLFPFILLEDEGLYYYKRTRGAGFQYFSLSHNNAIVKATKKKFSYCVFRNNGRGSQQALFWSEAIPALNVSGTIKANIPIQGLSPFVGRKKQIEKIKEEIVEIPNQNGIVYGPGGVGKTALIIELSKQIFEETHSADIIFDNIIWVSAKSNFYNPLLDDVDTKPQQFTSLENILHVLLRFFDHENVDEYNIDELKEIAFDLLETNKVLLILDNLETVTKKDVEAIVKFFQIEVKKQLRLYPNNFKVILTSRELIPSGFHQIKLEGLEYKDAKQLMKNLHEQYEGNGDQLTEEQFKLIHHATSGIPIVINHCFGQLYEFNQPLEKVLHGLCNTTNEVIKFSYSEIFSLIKQDELFIQLVLLLEILHEPLSIRQFSEILEKDYDEIASRLPKLLGLQCVERVNIGIEERFGLNQQVNLFVKSLLKDSHEITSKLRDRVTKNLTLERRMDYSSEEFEIIEVFKSYLDEKRFIEAEEFLKSEISKRPVSELLKLHYAEYLRDQRKDINEAIKILELLNSDITKSGKQNSNVLLALGISYTALEFPNYDKANVYYMQLLNTSPDEKCKFLVGEFFIRWSTTIKAKKEIDPIEEVKRRVKYKDLAMQGLSLLSEVRNRNKEHRYNFLMARGCFNKWDNRKALDFINTAISQAGEDRESVRYYGQFKEEIEQQLAYK